MKTKLSQKQKILTIMCRDKDKWFYPYEFMDNNLGDLFVGYKAPTRIAELAHDYPGMFLEKQSGKYTMRRLNGEKFLEWFPELSKDLRQVVAKELNYYPKVGAL